jgi:hypothetical protein
MKSKSFVLLVVLTLIFLGWFLYNNGDQFIFAPQTPGIQEAADQASSAEVTEEPAERLPMPPRHPVAPPKAAPFANEAQQPIALPLPETLDQADAYLDERLAQLIARRDLLDLVNLNYFIQKLVLFIDHLPEKSLPRLHLPIMSPKPGFVTDSSGERQVIGKRNARRYLPYVELVEDIPDAPLLQLYRGLYPLFQQAYREAGDPNGHFNDRLILVIDDLLQTPEPTEPIPVVHHISRFKYADESLESRSAGQKILLRMGVENSRRVKEKLRRIRRKLVREDW